MKLTKTGTIALFAALTAALLFWALIKREAPKKATDRMDSQQMSAHEAGASADKQMLETALKSPKSLDGAVSSLTASNRAESTPSVSPMVAAPCRQLLSTVEKPPLPQPLKEPVAAENLYFWKRYASLRSDGVRNPESAENRAGIVSLMQARQRRLGQAEH